MSRKFIGAVMVDSGQLFVADPCYLKYWQAGDFIPGEDLDNSYARVSQLTVSSLGGDIEWDVAVRAGDDGYYPVFAVENDAGRLLKLEIICSEEAGPERQNPGWLKFLLETFRKFTRNSLSKS